jgi:tRNA 5-methylaminomethyl-2-thiouridine biosynthesis bifunctional protein
MTQLDTADLTWEEGQPVSQHFGDVYFSKDDGLAETDHVFLQGNNLPQRFAELGPDENFFIAETGFGTGLNFLSAWRLWQRQATPGAQLHFVSLERFPLTPEDLAKAHALWPELAPLSEALLAQYPTVLHEGHHRLDFGPVQLTLIFADVTAGLSTMMFSDHDDWQIAFARRGVDAWFLDGFAPAKNPEMWVPELFTAMAKLSHSGTSLATFTCAGIVKRGLAHAGFNLEKIPGYGRKREMLIARGHEQPDQTARERKPARALAWMVADIGARPKSVAIIGAGLAGAITAQALAARGINVTVFERHGHPAMEASGNPQAVLYAKLSAQPGVLGEFNLRSLAFAQRFYAPYWSRVGAKCGVLQLALSDKDQLYQQRLVASLGRQQRLLACLDRSQAQAKAQIELPSGGIFFPDSGWLQPRKLCEMLLDQALVTLISDCDIQVLKRTRDHWFVVARQAHHGPYDAVVLACANEAAKFSQTQNLPLKPVRGQVSQLPATNHSANLATVLCANAYVAPSSAGAHCGGASYDLTHTDTAVRATDSAENLTQISELVPGAASEWAALSAADIPGRAALRATTPDYLPMVGPAPDADQFDQDFAALRRNAKVALPHTGSFHPGLYVNVGHGSRGLAYLPLSAHLLAAHMLAEPNPVGLALMQHLHPARFLIRDLIRNRR